MQINQEIYFSIIIPVYNVENYLHRCLDSILNQDFNLPFEIIAIDDSSTDSSLQILLDYQIRFKNFRVIASQYNEKLSATRLKGFQFAKGEYILNIDSDDWIVPEALSGIYNNLQICNPDVLVFNYKRQNSNGEVVYNRSITENSLHFDKNKVINHFLGACWNKVIKRDLITDMIYGQYPLNSQEDLIYSLEILFKSNSIYLVNDTYYIYFDNLFSITRKVNPVEYLQNQFFVLKELNKLFDRYKFVIVNKEIIFIYIEKFIYLAIAQIKFIKRKSELNFCNSLLIDFEKNALLPKNRINALKNAVNNRLVSLWMVYKYFTLKKSISIFFNGLNFIK